MAKFLDNWIILLLGPMVVDVQYLAKPTADFEWSHQQQDLPHHLSSAFWEARIEERSLCRDYFSNMRLWEPLTRSKGPPGSRASAKYKVYSNFAGHDVDCFFLFVLLVLWARCWLLFFLCWFCVLLLRDAVVRSHDNGSIACVTLAPSRQNDSDGLWPIAREHPRSEECCLNVVFASRLTSFITKS